MICSGVRSIARVECILYLCGMFIREVKKQRSKKSGLYYQYNLVQATRVDGKVKQRTILYLGAEELMKESTSRNQVLSILKAKIFGQEVLFSGDISEEVKQLALSYFEKYCVKFGQSDLPVVSIPPAPKQAEFHNIDIKALEIEDVKSFGAENLCKQILDKLELEPCLKGLGLTSEQTTKALIAIASKAIFSCSENKTAQILARNSELSACYKYAQRISHKQLYSAADLLYEHKSAIDDFLYRRVTDMFDLEDKIVIFDISNTYFETRKDGSKIAKRGRSKEKRTDCPIVVFTGVINSEGFIRHSNVYEGNTPDAKTLHEMIVELGKYSPLGTKQTIVMDAGIAIEENVDLVKKLGYNYVCVSRKRIGNYQLTNPSVLQMTDRHKQIIELSIFKPAGYTDTWMYVQSSQKRVKEQSMDIKLKAAFEEDMQSIQKALSAKSGTKKTIKVWERIGRIKQKHNRVSGQYEINVVEQNGNITEIFWTQKEKSTPKSDKENGVYFIRTNYENINEKELWSIYNTIREVESTFRCLKSDLQIRPVHHQKDSRIQSHIYLTILAYQLVNTIRHMLKQSNINYSWDRIKRIMTTQTMQTVFLTTDKKQIHLRKSSKPIQEVQDIYKATSCNSNTAATKKYVVYH